MPKDTGYPKGDHGAPQKGPLHTPFECTLDVPGKTKTPQNVSPKKDSSKMSKMPGKSY